MSAGRCRSKTMVGFILCGGLLRSSSTWLWPPSSPLLQQHRRRCTLLAPPFQHSTRKVKVSRRPFRRFSRIWCGAVAMPTQISARSIQSFCWMVFYRVSSAFLCRSSQTHRASMTRSKAKQSMRLIFRILISLCSAHSPQVFFLLHHFHKPI